MTTKGVNKLSKTSTRLSGCASDTTLMRKLKGIKLTDLKWREDSKRLEQKEPNQANEPLI